jgi:phosphatidylserine/phosphatidylglycerophosphate/cardiolipin synthase-like enzyme
MSRLCAALGVASLVCLFALAPVRRIRAQDAPRVLIGALHYFGREGALDEAIQLVNLDAAPVTLDASWSIATPFGAATRSLRFTGQTLAPNTTMWIAHDAAAFARQFGMSPTLTFDDLNGSLSLANAGGWLRLMRDGDTEPIDALVYGAAEPVAGWKGPALQPFVVTGTISAEGQLLLRRSDPLSGAPVTDTDSAADWTSHRGPEPDHNQPMYPAWVRDWAELAAPISAAGGVTVGIAPDASYALVASHLRSATRTIDIESYTFDQAALGALLVERAASGVRVRVLLDGAPAGGLSNQTRWICAQLAVVAAPDGGCWFMLSDSARRISARYRALHAKFAIVDDARVLLGSENFGMNGMPDDDKSDGTRGHRGVVVALDAPALVARARRIFDIDMGGAGRDVTPWCATGCAIGAPPAGFAPITVTGGVSYPVRYAEPLNVVEPVSALLSTSPETHLRGAGGLFDLLARAGPEDEIFVEQLDEPWHWGAQSMSRELAPNPRVEALIDAARRGARVTVLLDSGYDRASHPLSNAATVSFLRAQGLPTLRAYRADPARGGLHNKMMLMRIGGRGFAHVGSWNGSESSAKVNRELSVLIESDPVFEYLRTLFLADLADAAPVYLPIASHHSGTSRQLLISEIMINPSGNDLDGEWVEIHNPTGGPVTLAGFLFGDAILLKDGNIRMTGEDAVYRFPEGAMVPAGGTIVIAQNAREFARLYAKKPDFELGDYDAETPDLMNINGENGRLALGNDGDEVALLQSDATIVDVVTWLTGNAENTTPFGRSISAGYTLQRWPSTSDTDNCNVDFRLQPVPSVGRVP